MELNLLPRAAADHHRPIYSEGKKQCEDSYQQLLYSACSQWRHSPKATPGSSWMPPATTNRRKRLLATRPAVPQLSHWKLRAPSTSSTAQAIPKPRRLLRIVPIELIRQSRSRKKLWQRSMVPKKVGPSPLQASTCSNLHKAGAAIHSSRPLLSYPERTTDAQQAPVA